MLKIVGVNGDKYRVLDTDDSVEELASGEYLYECMMSGIHIVGCHFDKFGLVIELDGRVVPRGSVPVSEVWKPVLSPDIRFPNGASEYEVSNLGRLRVVARPSLSRDIMGRGNKVVPAKLVSISNGVVCLLGMACRSQLQSVCSLRLRLFLI